MKVGDLVSHLHYPELLGLIIETRVKVGISDPKHRQGHRVKWLKDEGIATMLGWNEPTMFGETELVVVSEA